ncbi:Os02g0231300 [Oryza sativa Japonica Group]|uniref:Os02g0231300 protein n=1 Tax=Oryza sativa subsp. japonica TaxID=39947 RepID=A0A0P0VGR1_ORYSJ|nr:Os02g0231300 [Oryza sativa Japonica Group]
MGGAERGGPGRNRSRPAKRRRPEQARGKAALHALPLLHHRAAAPPHSRRSGGGAEGQAEWRGGGMPRPRDELVDDTAPRTHRHDRRGGDCHVHPGAPPNPSSAPHHLPRRRAPRRRILPRVTLLVPNHTATSMHRTCATCITSLCLMVGRSSIAAAAGGPFVRDAGMGCSAPAGRRRVPLWPPPRLLPRRPAAPPLCSAHDAPLLLFFPAAAPAVDRPLTTPLRPLAPPLCSTTAPPNGFATLLRPPLYSAQWLCLAVGRPPRCSGRQLAASRHDTAPL